MKIRFFSVKKTVDKGVQFVAKQNFETIVIVSTSPSPENKIKRVCSGVTIVHEAT